MRNEYDFSTSRKNPFAKQLKRRVTLRLDGLAIDYFKDLTAELGLRYQNLINAFLKECALNRRRLALRWLREPARKPARRTQSGS